MLRIVQLVSAVVFAIACATLIALCIRSYYWANIVVWRNSILPVQVFSMEGRLKIVYIDWKLSGTRAVSAIGIRTDDGQADVISRYLRQDADHQGFRILRSHPTAVLFPYWLPILISGSLATLLGISRMRRFSLRFMLFLTAMVAILLAVIVRR